MTKVRVSGVVVVCGEHYIALGEMRGVVFVLSPPPLYFVFVK